MRGCIPPASLPSIIRQRAAAGMETRGNSGFELAETCWTLRFEGIHHFGFILKSGFAELGRIQIHLAVFLVFVPLPVRLFNSAKEKEDF